MEEDDSLATLSPGFWQVRGVAYSPDGKTLAASDLWGVVKLWDVATKRELASLGVGADGAGSSVTFSPDGRLLAWPSDLSHVRLWDLRRKRQAALLTPRASAAGVIYVPGTAGVIYGTVRFSPDSRLLAASGTDGTVRLWDVATGEALPPISAHRKLVVDLAFSPDGRLLATSGGDESVALWDMTTRREVTRLPRLGDVMGSLAFSPDGEILATSAHSSGAVNLWDVRTREIAATLRASRAAGVSVAFSPNGRQLAAGGSDGVLRLWDVATRREIAALVGHRKGISCVAFSPDGKTVATGSREGTVKLWRPAPKPQEILHGTPGGIYEIVVSPDGKTLASGNRKGVIALWDLQRERLIRAFKAHFGDVRSLAFSPDERRLASWGTDSRGRIWDLPAGHLRLTLPRRPAAFSPDGRLLVCAGNGNDHTIHLWNLAAGRGEAVLRGHTHEIGRLLFSPDGKILVASGHLEEVVRLWDIARRRQIDPPLPGHVGWGGPFAFSPDGKRLATISGGEFIVYVWDVATHRRIVSLPGNTDQINWIQFSPDGRTLGTGSTDGVIRLWSTASWSEVATMNDPDMDFGGAFSPDGTRLFTGDRDGSIRVWRAAALAEADVECARVEYQHEVDLAETLNGQSSVAMADKLKKWAAGLPALDWLIQAQPKDASYRIRRGQALMQLGQWSKAAADLARGFALGADNLGAETDLARAQLAVGNLPAYRKTCTALLDYMDAHTTEDADMCNDAAFVCALTSHAVDDPTRPVRLAEKAHALRLQDPGILTTLGATLYRARRFDAAIRQLTAKAAHDPQGGSPEDWLFLAMAHHATGDADLARRYLNRAERWMDAAMRPKPGTADASLPWDRRLQLQLLRREAEQVVSRR